jgi:transposase
MDRAYEGNETRQLAIDLGYSPVVPPKYNRIDAWEYNRVLYRRRNEVERLFRTVLLQQKSLDFPHRHATGVQGDDFVVKAGEAVTYPAPPQVRHNPNGRLGKNRDLFEMATGIE